ncbi:hypothetical protein [Niallia sp. Krafla_26]
MTHYIQARNFTTIKKQKYGKIINFTSMGAFDAYTVVLHYHAVKAAV